jgi:hypothetical protein
MKIQQIDLNLALFLWKRGVTGMGLNIPTFCLALSLSFMQRMKKFFMVL